MFSVLLLAASQAAAHEPPSPTLEHFASLEHDHIASLGVTAHIEANADTTSSDSKPVGYFLKSFNATEPIVLPLDDHVAQALDGLTHYRLLPAVFPKGMEYHFDGLATVLKMSVANGSLTIFSRAFESGAYEHYNKCLFYGTGTGPTLGLQLCFLNPAVNLLPIGADGRQLWLTIDTSSWGRVDPDSLATIPGASVDVDGAFTLNAHPACDPISFECFVQHPCPKARSPLTKDACISQLVPSSAHSGEVGMSTVRLSHIELPYEKLIQHSHSPCLTPSFVIAKLDAFHARDPINSNSGLLKFALQGEDDLWMVMDRRTNASRVLTSPGHKFVNNHFWNCYEDAAGDVVVEAVPATSEYLDNYFERNLRQPSVPWAKLLTPPLRCLVPMSSASSAITCTPMFGTAAVPPSAASVLAFDYPTFNPRFKMRNYRFFYGIAPSSAKARWFDTLIKVDRSNTTRSAVVGRWASPGVYLTEADFVPLSASTSMVDEDNGILVTVLYNETADESLVGFFDAKSVAPMGIYPMGMAVPFHAHGIVCPKGERCFTNP